MFNTANSDLVLLKLSLIFFAVYAVNDRAVYIDIKRNYRLLQVCYAPTTSATVLAIFLLQPLTVLMRQAKHAVHAVN